MFKLAPQNPYYAPPPLDTTYLGDMYVF